MIHSRSRRPKALQCLGDRRGQSAHARHEPWPSRPCRKPRHEDDARRRRASFLWGAGRREARRRCATLLLSTGFVALYCWAYGGCLRNPRHQAFLRAVRRLLRSGSLRIAVPECLSSRLRGSVEPASVADRNRAPRLHTRPGESCSQGGFWRRCPTVPEQSWWMARQDDAIWNRPGHRRPGRYGHRKGWTGGVTSRSGCVAVRVRTRTQKNVQNVMVKERRARYAIGEVVKHRVSRSAGSSSTSTPSSTTPKSGGSRSRKRWTRHRRGHALHRRTAQQGAWPGIFHR